jgi:hypothetical protein
MAPTLELPLSVLLLPIHEPYEVDTLDSTKDSKIVIVSAFDPSAP